jgi:hypothetical protein
MSSDTDDFISDINAAVDAGGSVPDPEPQQPQQPPRQVAPDPDAASSVENAVLDVMGESEYERDERIKKEEAEKAKQQAAPPAQKEKETLSLPKKEGEAATTATAPDPAQKATTPEDDDKKPYLDRFLREDEQGNLINAEGEVIAPAGKARAYYERVKKEGREARDHANRLALSNHNLGTKFKELFESHKKLEDQVAGGAHQQMTQLTGMNEAEVQDVLNFARQYKQNPVEAIKGILTKAQLNGIDLSKLGVQGQLDPAMVRETIAGIVKEQISPISEQFSAQSREAQAAREVEEFERDFADLAEHHEVVAEAIRRTNGKMPLREIGLRLRASLQAAEQEQQNPPAQQQQPPQRQEPPRQRSLQRIVTPPPRAKDYTNMSFAQIAENIAKELDQT